MSDIVNIHGTGIVLGSHGVIFRGPSGAGKSVLALELLEHAGLSGLAAKLVADDRLDLTVKDGKLIMSAPPTIGGMIELRGRGIVSRPHVKSATVHLIADVGADLSRLVEEDELTTEIEGVTIARCPVPGREHIEVTHQRLLVLEALRALKPAAAKRGKKTA